MSGKHLALVVEDHAETAEDLEAILSSLGFEAVIVDNKAQALEAVGARSFCLCVLDLQIRGDRRGIGGHVEHGRSLLRELRSQFPEHTGRSFRLPILIVSGFARERDEALEIAHDGAHSVIQKPLSSGVLSAAVRRALDESGRSTHAACSAVREVAAAAPAKERVVLAIPGDRDQRRVRVTVDGRVAAITETSLAILLQLMVAHAKGEGVHKNDLGASDEKGFRGVSVLRDQLKAAGPGAAEVVENHYFGKYKLSDRVVIGKVNADHLAVLDNATITALAKRLATPEKRRRR